MILPSSYFVALLLCVVAMLCWAILPLLSRQATTREDRWGFELFYFDFAVAAFFTSIVLALTAGTMGYDGFTFGDILNIAAKRRMAVALVAGAIGNLGMLLLLAATSISGLAHGFVVWGAGAILMYAVWTALQAKSVEWISVSLVGLLAVMGIALAIRAWVQAYRRRVEDRARKTVESEPVSSSGRRRRRKARQWGLGPWKAVLLAVFGGLFFGMFLPITKWAFEGEDGLGPYATGFFLAVGVVGSTFIYNLFFMNLPVRGQPVDILDYVRLNWKLHFYGVVGGVLWMVATVAVLVAMYSQDRTGLPLRTAGALTLLAAVIGGLVGVLFRREYRDVTGFPKVAALASCVTLAAAVGLLAVV